MTRITIRQGGPEGPQRQEQPRRASGRGRERYLTAEALLRYLLQADDSMDTLIKCNPQGERLVTTDQSIYEAVGSLKGYDNVNLRNLVKLLEVVDIVSFSERMASPRTILTEGRVDELRKAALSAGAAGGPGRSTDTQKKHDGRPSGA